MPDLLEVRVDVREVRRRAPDVVVRAHQQERRLPYVVDLRRRRVEDPSRALSDEEAVETLTSFLYAGAGGRR